MSEWSVAEPGKLTFDDPLTSLHVRIVNGTVNVMGTEDSTARLEVSGIEGPPLTVTHKNGTLTVAYDDLPWRGFLKWLDRKGWHRSRTSPWPCPPAPAWRSAWSAPTRWSRASRSAPR